MMLDVLPEFQFRDDDDNLKDLARFITYRYGSSTEVRVTHKRLYAPVASVSVEPATTIAIKNHGTERAAIELGGAGNNLSIDPGLWTLYTWLDGLNPIPLLSLGVNPVLLEILAVWNYELVDQQ